VPLSHLEGIMADAPTQHAIDDWQYWVKQGYPGLFMKTFIELD